MKKRFLPLFLLLGVATLGLSTGFLKNNTSVVHEAKADEKETVYFNITSAGAYNDNLIILNVDKTLPTGNHKMSVFYNGSYNDFWVNYGSETTVYFTWSGHKPVGTTTHHHYRLDAGSVYFEDASIKYVLEHVI